MNKKIYLMILFVVTAGSILLGTFRHFGPGRHYNKEMFFGSRDGWIEDWDGDWDEPDGRGGHGRGDWDDDDWFDDRDDFKERFGDRDDFEEKFDDRDDDDDRFDDRDDEDDDQDTDDDKGKRDKPDSDSQKSFRKPGKTGISVF